RRRDSTSMELEAMPVAGDKDVDAARSESLGEGPVGGDDPSSVAYGRVENGYGAAAGDWEDWESPGQGQCGSRVGHPPRDQALELVDDGRGNDDAGPRTEAVDLGFQRETTPSWSRSCSTPPRRPRSTNRWAFWFAVFGISSRNSRYLGTMKNGRFVTQNSKS